MTGREVLKYLSLAGIVFALALMAGLVMFAHQGSEQPGQASGGAETAPPAATPAETGH